VNTGEADGVPEGDLGGALVTQPRVSVVAFPPIPLDGLGQRLRTILTGTRARVRDWGRVGWWLSSAVVHGERPPLLLGQAMWLLLLGCCRVLRTQLETPYTSNVKVSTHHHVPRYDVAMTPANLSDALDLLTGKSSVSATPDGSRIVALRHSHTWAVAFRLRRQSGRQGQWDMTEMSARFTGKGSATAQDLRSLPLGELLGRARALTEGGPDGVPVTQIAGTSFVSVDALRLAPFLTDGRGRGKRSDADFAGLAVEYALLVGEGNAAPAKSLSERHGHGSPATWANRITEARRRGLLTKVKPGQSGGSLTAKAEHLLGIADESED
jgi:hypothetical protein